NHPLAEAVIAQAKTRELPPAELQFNYSDHDGKISILKPLCGQSGYLALSLFTIESLDQAEDHLIFSAMTDTGISLDEEVARRLISLPGEVAQGVVQALSVDLDGITQKRQTEIRRTISERNARFFEAEAEKLDGWADDLKLRLEREIKEFDRQIKEVRKAAVASLTLEEKLVGQKQIKSLESERGKRRRALFDAQDQIDQRRDKLIGEIEGKLQQKVSSQQLFAIRWQVQ
ncbi:MAG: DEAD/DEAH box helicase, partial [Nitrospirales bacterium]|nr:DEAD/DEAH box helicase [Nitrospirales bacterium]